MKTVYMIFMVLALLSACSTVKHVAPDGTTIAYFRFMAGSDSIKVNLGNGVTAEINKQTVDTKLLESVLGALVGAAK